MNMIEELDLDLPGRIWRSRMPMDMTYDDTTIHQWMEADITHVVCLQEVNEMQKYTAAFLPEEYSMFGFTTIHQSTPDHCGPEDYLAWWAAVKDALEALNNDARVVVHCHAGIGRTGMFLASLLMLHNTIDSSQAISSVRSSADCLKWAVNHRQRAFLEERK